MVSYRDVHLGEIYSLLLPNEDTPVLAEFSKEMRDGRLKFCRDGTDLEIYVDGETFDDMRDDGRAKRIRLDRQGRVIDHVEIDPVSFLDPDETGIAVEERELRLRKRADLVRKQTLRFYVMRYDEEPRPTRGRKGVERIIKRHLPSGK